LDIFEALLLFPVVHFERSNMLSVTN